MKPLKLTMKNIASFSGEHSVDFSLLADMFLICGKTGAGKSTVLDAITYALYGSLPGARRQNDIRRLRSDFCGAKDECFVRFEFLLGGKPYRIERNLPVSRITRNGTVKEDGESAALFCTEKDTEVLLSDKKSETDSLIKSLIRLSAEEFSRIILLPQGDFADFLRQNSTERKAMLSKLFPVERFRVTAEALKDERVRLASMHEEVIQNIERIAPAFSADAAENLRTEYKKRLKQAEKQSEDLRGTVFNLKLRIDETEKNENSCREYAELQKERQTLEDKAGEYEKAQKLLGSLRFALGAEPLLSAAEEAERNLRRAEAELEENSKRLSVCMRTRADLEREKGGREEDEKRLRQNALDIQKTELALNALAGMKNAETESDEAEKNLNTSRLQAEQIRKEAVELAQAEQRQKELTAEYENERYGLQYAEYLYLRAQENTLSRKERALQTTVDGSRAILEEFLKEKEAEDIVCRAAEIALYLQEAKPCPVCGSIEHPFPAQKSPQKLDTEEKIETQRALTAEAEKNLEEIQDAKKELKGRINQSRALCAERTGETVENTELIESEEKALKNREDVRERLFSITRALREGEKKIAEKSRCEQDLRRAEQECAAYEAQNASAKARLNEAKKLVQNLLSDTARIEIDAASGTLLLSVQQRAAKLHTERRELEKRIRIFTEKSIQTEKKYAELTGIIGTVKADIQSRTKEYTERTAAFNEAAAKAPYEAFQVCGFADNGNDGTGTDNENRLRHYCKLVIKELVRDKAAAEGRSQTLENQIETYKTDKQRLELLCSEKKAALPVKKRLSPPPFAAKGELFTAEDFQTQSDESDESIEELFLRLSAEKENLLHKKEEAESQLAQNEKNCTELRRLAAETEARINEYKELEDRRLELGKKLHVYERLHDAVSGKNPNKLPLESWVLRMYLEEVCMCAGKRLERISDGRYTLYLKKPEGGKGFQGLDLEIYDSYTGKRRPCSTLSGGETFMASISLALAVSDTVQAKNGGIQLDSLFIDEGFGSLDETSLDKALSVLDEIRGSRCIGLVSHVGLLKTRIPSRLDIEKGISGSRIKTVQG
ncbi:AAA family ATPase [Treponema sp. HNW]|uniref:AAA family ATPase n=1 Tax=Treponema sp. HNW TaxID=3116654 RepID=UPI003D0BDBB2